jgi:Holliday junction resolvase-like predicted endonuclease
MITVTRQSGDDPLVFDVVVGEAGGVSRHRVTLTRADLARLVGARAPERLIEAAFRFLLEREPKESILARFDVSVIARYFPEFERELPRYLTDGE